MSTLTVLALVAAAGVLIGRALARHIYGPPL